MKNNENLTLSHEPKILFKKSLSQRSKIPLSQIHIENSKNCNRKKRTFSTIPIKKPKNSNKPPYKTRDSQDRSFRIKKSHTKHCLSNSFIIPKAKVNKNNDLSEIIPTNLPIRKITTANSDWRRMCFYKDSGRLSQIDEVDSPEKSQQNDENNLNKKIIQQNKNQDFFQIFPEYSEIYNKYSQNLQKSFILKKSKLQDNLKKNINKTIILIRKMPIRVKIKNNSSFCI